MVCQATCPPAYRMAASLEQLVGTLNLEDVLRDGQVRLAPVSAEALAALAREGRPIQSVAP